jgi:HK97 family phage major capsid protein
VQASEQRAASEGTGSAGGFGVPFFVDPTLIITTLDQAEIGLIANIVTITTNKWHGVSAAGVSSGFTAEGSVVADGSPTFAQPEIDVWADKFYAPASLELTMDYPGWLDEITRLFMAQWANDVSEYTAIGTGTAQPTGVFTAMQNQTSNPSHCTVTTAGQICAADLRKAWAALPERYRLNANRLMSPSVVQQISALAAPTVTNGLGPSEWTFTDDGQPRLFGRGVAQSSYAPAWTGTSGAANIAVVGDFSRFYIVHRSGLDVELVTGVPNFPSSNLPTGSVGVFGMSRFGSDVVDTNAFRILSN